jgi:predicted Holliday junction resolvase-like endonuclease
VGESLFAYGAAAAFIICLAVFAAKYFALKASFDEDVHKQLAEWKNKELDGIRFQIQRIANEEMELKLEKWRFEMEASIREDAIKRSSSVVSGKVTEHLVPYFGNFPYNPKDARFLGTPIDLIVFDGMSEDNLNEIVFLEVKTGSSSLSTRERRIKEAIMARKVVWKEFRVQLGPKDQ